MDISGVSSGSLLTVSFIAEGSSVGEDLREFATAFETRCRLDVDLDNRFERHHVTTTDGTLGWDWAGALVFLLTHSDQVEAFCRALHSAALHLIERKKYQFIVVLTLANGAHVEFRSEQADLKDINEIRKQLAKLLKDLSAIPDETKQ